MQGEKKTMLGYDEEQIRKSFRQKEMSPNITRKISPDKTTLATLIEGAEAISKEEKEYLEDVYKKLEYFE